MRNAAPRVGDGQTSFLTLVLVVGCAIVGLDGCGRNDEFQTLALKSRCREDGERVRQEWKKTYFQDVFSDEPLYAYNPNLKTCLWLGEYTGPSADRDDATGKIIPVTTHVRFILDVYSNKTLLEYTEHDGKPIGEVSKLDFERRKLQLFSH